MSVACGLLAISAGACSSLLGIDDPHSGSGDDGGVTDGPPTGADHLTLSLADPTIKQSQRVPFRVTAVYPDNSMQDATGSATYETDNAGVAGVGAPGQLEGGAQAGTATITVRFGAAKPATLNVTVSAKSCGPVINELQTGSAASSADEWVELVNPCTTAIDVTGWTLVYRAATTTGGTDSTLMYSLTGSMPEGAFWLFAGQDYAGTNDGKWPTGGSSGIMAQVSGAVALRKGAISMGPIADAVAYGTVTGGHPFIEGTALPAMTNGRPAQRLPYDGRDSDDGAADFMVVAAGASGTPRETNTP